VGISTGDFERRFRAGLTELRRSHLLAGIADGAYLNDPLGIAVEFPHGWIVRTWPEVADTAEERLLSSHEQNWNDAFRSLTDAFLPLVTVSARTWDDPVARLGPHELSPVAALQFEHAISDDEAPAFALGDHVATDLAYFHAHMEDYRLEGDPSHVTLSRCEAIAYCARYTVLHADAVEGCPARERAFYVRHDSGVYALRLCDYPERHARLAFDFSSFTEQVYLR
jgi:hypothetical protein